MGLSSILVIGALALGALALGVVLVVAILGNRRKGGA
jgi:hypothetical protein